MDFNLRMDYSHREMTRVKAGPSEGPTRPRAQPAPCHPEATGRGGIQRLTCAVGRSDAMLLLLSCDRIDEGRVAFAAKRRPAFKGR